MATKITEKFLNHRDLFGIEWQGGVTFHEVLGWESAKYKPYKNLEDIESGTDLGGRFTRLEDDAGDDILYVEKGDTHSVIHAGIGHRPAVLRRYTFYPENQSKTGKFPNLQAPSPGDEYGYVDGEDSPYEEPTDAQELMMPPGVRASFDFHNPGNDTHYPVLNIKARVYNVRVLDPQSSEDINQIKRIASPGSPAPIFPVGTTRAKAEFTMDRQWSATPISISQARDLGGGGR